ncbi:hypothetical protein BDZ94DRAFT_1314150 [Collybia nuda]|uniref:Uncharacterized protein n=1 Tax=Collybia nuda TaxID=64659 RepID=A0A9P5XVK5_9AGAR|nr:hypothetical protein BDZ94DRAFT_1314150 [Collybia nuda]
MSYPQSPSRRSQRTSSRASHIQIPHTAPVPQYPPNFPGNFFGQDASPLGISSGQANIYQQQSPFPQGQNFGPTLPDLPGQPSTPAVGQAPYSSNMPISPRGPPISSPYSMYNPDNGLRTPSLNHEPRAPTSPRHPPAQSRRPTERTRRTSTATPRERRTEDSSATVIEVFSPGTSRSQRHERNRAVSSTSRSHHRHEDRQALARSSGTDPTPPAQYYGPVGSSHVDVYHMYKPTFVVQPKEEKEPEPEAPKKKKGFLTRVFESDSKK